MFLRTICAILLTFSSQETYPHYVAVLENLTSQAYIFCRDLAVVETFLQIVFVVHCISNKCEQKLFEGSEFRFSNHSTEER